MKHKTQEYLLPIIDTPDTPIDSFHLRSLKPASLQTCSSQLKNISNFSCVRSSLHRRAMTYWWGGGGGTSLTQNVAILRAVLLWTEWRHKRFEARKPKCQENRAGQTIHNPKTKSKSIKYKFLSIAHKNTWPNSFFISTIIIDFISQIFGVPVVYSKVIFRFAIQN